MMRLLLLLPLLATPLALGGCVRTAASIVKAPFQVVGKAADLATTSQSEADRNYGKKMRQAEEREGKERRAWARRCDGNADRDGCDRYDGFVAADVAR